MSIFDTAKRRIATRRAKLAELELKLHDDAALQRAVDYVFDGVRVVWNEGDATVWVKRCGEDRIAFCVINTDQGHLDRALEEWRQNEAADYLGIYA